MGPMISKSELVELTQTENDNGLIEEPKLVRPRVGMVRRLRLLWNERRFMARCMLSGLVAAALVAFLIPKKYESTAQLMPPDSQSTSSLALLASLSGGSGGTSGGAGGLTMLASDLLGIKSNGALFMSVLRSRTVQDRLVDQFDLKKVYGKSLQIRARDKLNERTAISEDRKSGVITITVTDRDPKRAAALAAAYVDELNLLIAQLSTSSAHRERVFLENRLASVKVDLDAAEKDFSQFASTEGAIDIPQQGKAMVEAAAMLQGQLIAAQAELQGLKQIYTDQNVRVRATEARINGLREQLRKLGGTGGETEQADADTTSEAPYPTMRRLPILGVPFADKLRRMKVQEALFEALTKQYELAKVQEAKEIPSVKVLDAPVVPESRSYPPRILVILLGLSVTTVAGVVWVFAAARWQEIDPQSPGKVLALEVFDSVATRIPLVSRNGHENVDVVESDPEESGNSTAKGARAGS
jgi:uncharacterized protein involved in exopolysaccharide biosynthesis